MHFDAALQYVLSNEGGFVDDPADRGGATNFGITERVLMRWRGKNVSREDMKALTQEEAAKIYRKFYWDPLVLDQCSDAGVACAVFDVCVNMGIARAGTILHLAMGQFDSLATLEARPFLARFIPAVQDRYIDIALGSLTQTKFLRGWINRSQRMIGLMV